MIITDETLSGQKVQSFTLHSLSERLSAREIIRARIWQEVQEHNASERATAFHGLVQPTEAERRLNDAPGKGGKKPAALIDWEKQYEVALRAFAANGFFMIIGNRQAADLDEEFEVEAETEVSFVRLMALAGG